MNSTSFKIIKSITILLCQQSNINKFNKYIEIIHTVHILLFQLSGKNYIFSVSKEDC